MFHLLDDAGLQFLKKVIKFLVNKGISSIALKKHLFLGKLLAFEATIEG